MLDEVEKIAARGAGSVLPFTCVGSVEADVNSRFLVGLDGRGGPLFAFPFAVGEVCLADVFGA